MVLSLSKHKKQGESAVCTHVTTSGYPFVFPSIVAAAQRILSLRMSRGAEADLSASREQVSRWARWWPLDLFCLAPFRAWPRRTSCGLSLKASP